MKFFRANSPTTLVFIAGEGGHIEQAQRILATLDEEVRAASHCVLITDTDSVNSTVFDECWTIHNCAPKYRDTKITDYFLYAHTSIKTFWRLLRHHDVRMAIVTGPGFSLVPALGAKVLGAYLIVFESWSRFETRSNCSKVLYRFADQFCVQHEELLKLYPKATWVGLL